MSYKYQFDVWLSLNVWSGSSLKIWWKVACKLCYKGSFWIQYENWWNVVHGGAEGRSLQWGGCSSLPVVAGKREQGVVAPFQERFVNKRRLYPSAGGCLRAGMSLRQYMVVRSFLYNKYWRQRRRQRWFSPELGFHLKSWCSCVLIMCDDLFCSYCTCLLLTKHLMNECCTDLSEELLA